MALITTVATAAMIGTATVPAVADEADPIETIAPEVYDDVAPAVDSALPGVAAQADAGGLDLTIPENGTRSVELTSADKDIDIGVTLPVNRNDSLAQPGSHGTVEYVGDDTTATVVPKNDGSVQFVTTIRNGSAPTDYSYDLDLPKGSQILFEDGDTALVVVDADGKFVAGIAPAWARDANGRELPTHYVVSGHTVTQVVEHVGSEVAYPVVADPWLGLYLIQNWYWGTYEGAWRMNSTPTAWSRALNSATQAGWATIGYAGWDELANYQTGSNRARMNASMQEQHVCHQGFAPHDAEWNVEGGKPARGNPYAWISSLCN